MHLHEKAKQVRNAALTDMRLAHEAGHTDLVRELAMKVVRNTRLTEDFAMSSLGAEYYKLDVSFNHEQARRTA